MLERIAEQHGLAITFASASKHQIAELEKGGRRRKIYFAVSPSDHRGTLNLASAARKIIRAEGWATDAQ